MSYLDECQTALQRIEADNTSVSCLRPFLGITAQWHAAFDQDQSDSPRSRRTTPMIVVLGHGVPEQLIRACGVSPLHVLGGSHASCAWSDDLMPRDSDPASRSILGYALRLAQRGDLDPLFVVPTENDNMRKIAYLLRRAGHKVLSLDLPPTIASVACQQAWERSVDELVQTVERHAGRRATARNIRWADQLVAAARAALLEFERTCAACDEVLTAEARLLVLDSYYKACDLAQWTSMLYELCAEMRTRHQTMGCPVSSDPRVLVVGSPILFPQHKVAKLVRDAGLCLLATVDATSTARYASLSPEERRGGRERLIRAIARKHYALDSSGAHVVNGAMEQYVEHLLSIAKVDGVVCHILKGQIEHDFLLARMEPLLEQRGVPVFRLETDYQYQDVEQLRIRLEAFAEMLGQCAIVASRESALDAAGALRRCA